MSVQTPRSTCRFWLLWLPTFLGFPLEGLAASLMVGPVQTPLEALLGSTLTGTIIGVARWLALRSLYGVGPVRVLNTAVGLALGLSVSVALFGTATDALTLLARGFVTGLGVGAAQALAFRTPLSHTGRWPLHFSGRPPGPSRNSLSRRTSRTTTRSSVRRAHFFSPS